jgi:hypothetical protein
MTRRGQLSIICAAIALVAAPLFAQQSNNERIDQLEKRLNDLTQQVTAIRTELNELKGATPAAAATAATTQSEDLTKVEVATAAPTVNAQQANPANEQPQTAMTDVQTVNNIPNPGASKVFNPDTSVIANFSGKAGKTNPFEFPGDTRQTMQLEEAEMAFQAWVDPYAKANFFFSVTPEGIEVEEGYAQFVTLPYDLTAKVGKFKAMFGKANTWHTHVRPWVDQPLVIHNFFGDEQFSDDGISVSKLFPNSFALVEATGEVYRGNTPGIFENRKESDLSYNGHVKLFKDITENSNIELGSSYARGTTPTVGGTNQFGGLDVTYRWKPLQQGLYRSLIARFEGIVNDRPDVSKNLKGFYTSLDYQLAQRWFTGVRLDRSDRFGSGQADKGISATLTFWPSEFSQLRGQLRRTSYGDTNRSFNELLFQLQFAIGAHGAHTF